MRTKINRIEERLNTTAHIVSYRANYCFRWWLYCEVSKKMTMAISTLICSVVKTFCLYGRQFIFPTTSFRILIQIMILIKSSYDCWRFVSQLGGFTVDRCIVSVIVLLNNWSSSDGFIVYQHITLLCLPLQLQISQWLNEKLLHFIQFTAI